MTTPTRTRERIVGTTPRAAATGSVAAYPTVVSRVATSTGAASSTGATSSATTSSTRCAASAFVRRDRGHTTSAAQAGLAVAVSVSVGGSITILSVFGNNFRYVLEGHRLFGILLRPRRPSLMLLLLILLLLVLLLVLLILFVLLFSLCLEAGSSGSSKRNRSGRMAVHTSATPVIVQPSQSTSQEARARTAMIEMTAIAIRIAIIMYISQQTKLGFLFLFFLQQQLGHEFLGARHTPLTLLEAALGRKAHHGSQRQSTIPIPILSHTSSSASSTIMMISIRVTMLLLLFCCIVEFHHGGMIHGAAPLAVVVALCWPSIRAG
jgi:hypothetical protein